MSCRIVPVVVAAALGLSAVCAVAPNAQAASAATVLPSIASTALPTSLCSANVLFIGARGSSETVTATNDGFGDMVPAVFTGFVSGIAAGTTVQPIYIDYPAVATTSLWTALAAVATDPSHASDIVAQNPFLLSVNQGVAQVVAVLAAAAQCPGQVVVLAGYSQGALVVHAGLAAANATPAASAKLDASLGGVVLIGDAASTGGRQYGILNGDNGQRGTASDTATADETGRVGLLAGILTQMPQLATALPLPAALDATQASRVLNVCDAQDIICDSTPAQVIADVMSGPDGGPRSLVHISYAAADLANYGRGAAFQANQALGKGLQPVTVGATTGMFGPVQAGSGLGASVIGVAGHTPMQTFAAYASDPNPAVQTLPGSGYSVQYDGVGKIGIVPGTARTVQIPVQYALGPGQPVVHQLYSRVLSGVLTVTIQTPVVTGCQTQRPAWWPPCCWWRARTC